MKLMITGGNGMLGKTLCRMLPLLGYEVFPVDLHDFDITDFGRTREAVAALRPDVVVHTAALTAVDDCEEKADLAMKVNGMGSASVAAASRAAGAKIVAISTDYVFGEAIGRPRHEWDAPAPQTVYGRSKLAGEEAVRAHNPAHLIVRIAWLYGRGGPSFVHTMLKLGRAGGAPLKVVNDQIGNPTSCEAVACGLHQLLQSGIEGTAHLTCEAETNWYEFTKAIFAQAGIAREVHPCTTAEFPRPAPRPADSRLEKRVLRLAGLPPMPHWQEALERFLHDEVEAQ